MRILAGAVKVVSSLEEDADASDDEIITTVESAAGNELKAIGNAIMENVPAIMSALDTLTKIHPFLEGDIEFFSSNPCVWTHMYPAAYLPFKFIVSQ